MCAVSLQVRANPVRPRRNGFRAHLLQRGGTAGVRRGRSRLDSLSARGQRGAGAYWLHLPHHVTVARATALNQQVKNKVNIEIFKCVLRDPEKAPLL